MNRRSLGLAVLLLAAAAPAFAATKSWTAGANCDNWYMANCWNPAGVPGAADTATIGVADQVKVNGSSPTISFSSLTIGSPANIVASLTLSTTIASGGSVLIYKNAGLTQGTTRQLVITGDFTMISGSSLTHMAESAASISSVNIRVTGSFDLRLGSTITVSARGYRGGAQTVAGSGPGGGGAAAAGNNLGGGGAGYGGAGGAGVGGAAGTAAYGSLTAPINLGSGGGGSGNTGAGSSGGGVVILNVGAMKLDGAIISSGAVGGAGTNNATAAGGGGSGGGVFITAGSFQGTGSINVSGGAGGTDSTGAGFGGGGGGGRVSIVVTSSGVSCGVSITTAAGAAGGAGAGVGITGTFNDQDLLAGPAAFTGTVLSSTSIDWDWSLTLGATEYQVMASTGGAASAKLGAAVATVTSSALTPNTTHVFLVRARACGAEADSATASTSTFAADPTAAAARFPLVNESSMTVAWLANNNPVNVTSYTVTMTTMSVFPNGATGNVTLSTLPAGASPMGTPTGLNPNTTYFLFVAAKNHAGVFTTAVDMSTSASTLALLPNSLTFANTFPSVQSSTVSVAWVSMPASPSSRTAEGYLIEISSTNFGLVALGGTVNSSGTTSVSASTLTVSYPDATETTNYYRVSTLNWQGRKNYLAIGKMNFEIWQSTDYISLGTLDAVSRSTVATSSVVVRNVGDIDASFILSAATVTAGSPWVLSSSSGPDVAVLYGLWNSGPPAPAPASFSTVMTTAPRISGGAGGAYAGNQNAQTVTAGSQRVLWVRFLAPTSTSNTSAQTLRVTVDAAKP